MDKKRKAVCLGKMSLISLAGCGRRYYFNYPLKFGYCIICPFIYPENCEFPCFLYADGIC